MTQRADTPDDGHCVPSYQPLGFPTADERPTEREHNPCRVPLDQQVPWQIKQAKGDIEEQDEERVFVALEIDVLFQAVRFGVGEVAL